MKSGLKEVDFLDVIEEDELVMCVVTEEESFPINLAIRALGSLLTFTANCFTLLLVFGASA